ncbi:unnamed protein product [Auanema sp. JU1783]|nr:unnamed protein product [Auanema sp. JU1783]
MDYELEALNMDSTDISTHESRISRLEEQIEVLMKAMEDKTRRQCTFCTKYHAPEECPFSKPERLMSIQKKGFLEVCPTAP